MGSETIRKIDTPDDFFKQLGMESDDHLSKYLEKNHPLKIQVYDNPRGYDEFDESSGPFIDFTPHPQFTLWEDSKKRGLKWDDLDADTYFQPIELNFPVYLGRELDAWDILDEILEEVQQEYTDWRSTWGWKP